jgi:tRNA A37 threonylcarbamoyladenosine synthetase subunit TsaC/SUA5/YrdC
LAAKLKLHRQDNRQAHQVSFSWLISTRAFISFFWPGPVNRSISTSRSFDENNCLSPKRKLNKTKMLARFIIAVLAGFAAAAPTATSRSLGDIAAGAKDLAGDVVDDAQDAAAQIKASIPEGCDAAKCVVALAGTIVACAAAAAEEGLNPIADAGCFAAAANAAVNTPAVCTKCW